MDDVSGTPSRAEQRRRTEARILETAARLFVESGYERTTIRAIARAAGVDAGLVMHYFGSKQELFQRVTHASPAQPLGGTPEQVSEQILAILADSLTSEPVQSLAVLRSMLTILKPPRWPRRAPRATAPKSAGPSPPRTPTRGPPWSAPS